MGRAARARAMNPIFFGAKRAFLSSVAVTRKTLRAIAPGMTAARWYDPTSGKYAEVKGSPFANEGGRQFVPSGANNSGDGDWVLVLEAPTSR